MNTEQIDGVWAITITDYRDEIDMVFPNKPDAIYALNSIYSAWADAQVVFVPFGKTLRNIEP